MPGPREVNKDMNSRICYSETIMTSIAARILASRALEDDMNELLSLAISTPTRANQPERDKAARLKAYLEGRGIRVLEPVTRDPDIEWCAEALRAHLPKVIDMSEWRTSDKPKTRLPRTRQE